jgi:hypothetical protein
MPETISTETISDVGERAPRSLPQRALKWDDRSAAARLQFAVEFATLPLDRLSSAQGHRLRQRLTAFLAATPTDQWIVRVTKGPSPARVPSRALASLQAAVRGLLNQAADGRGPATLLGADRDLAVFITSSTSVRYRLRPVVERRWRRLWVIGSVRTAVLFTLAVLLTHQEVRRCPSCDRLFVSSKKIFCSTRCRMRLYMQFARAGKTALYRQAFTGRGCQMRLTSQRDGAGCGTRKALL